MYFNFSIISLSQVLSSPIDYGSTSKAQRIKSGAARNKSQKFSNTDFNILRQLAKYLIAIVSPATELHIAMLVVEGEPRDVYLACALEDARWHIQTTAVMFDHYICVVRAIESLIRAVVVYHYADKNNLGGWVEQRTEIIREEREKERLQKCESR